MKFGNKRLFAVLFVVLIFISNVTLGGYSYWDNSQKQNSQNVPIGSWNFYSGNINPGVSAAISNYVNDQIALDPNSNLQTIYDQTGNLVGITTTIDNISVYDYIWDITGTGTKNPSTMGYVSLIDRALDGSSNPIHSIYTTYTTTPAFPEYNYFTSYDATNSNTNNQYSLRLNYGVSMTTDTAITNLSSVSFYAARGLSDPNDPNILDSNRLFSVHVSPDGVNWTLIGSDTPPVATNTLFNYGFYTYNVPGGLQGQNLFLRITYDGGGTKLGKDTFYSRLVVDELVVTTN